MTAAYRFRGLGWFLAVVVVALGFYLVSLQVAAERKKVADLDRQIIDTDRDIRQLETEFNTRANLAQLERWNGEVLALSAPSASQYLADDVQLASMDFRGGNGDSGVRVANYLVPTLPVTADQPNQPTPAPTTPLEHPAPAPVQMASVDAPVTVVQPARPIARPAALVVAAAHEPLARTQRDPRHDRAVAMVDRKLLADATLGDLLSRAHIDTESAR